MSMPSLTADVSLYRTGSHYFTFGSFAYADGVGPGPTIPVKDPIYLSIIDIGRLAPDVSTLLLGGFGVEGGRCWPPDAQVPTIHCDDGFGCNVATDRCEKCGQPGQPCCDGPRSAFSGRCYYPGIGGNSSCKSCQDGAYCDTQFVNGEWTGSRTCRACGVTEGGPCCPPDVRYAVSRCGNDAATGKRLACSDPSAGTGGTCVACGEQEQPVCQSGTPCNSGILVERGGICRRCGDLGQPACDTGCSTPFFFPDSNGICVPAGREGQMCVPYAGQGIRGQCFPGLVCEWPRRCVRCGGESQPCCPDIVVDPAGSRQGHSSGQSPCGLGLVCSAGRCTPCGNENQICCANNSCAGLADCVSGICRLHSRRICRHCTDTSQCFGERDEHSQPRCIDGHCRTYLINYDNQNLYNPLYCPDERNPWDRCEGVQCGLGETCFLGMCRTCGYPNGECCHGPIVGFFGYGCDGGLSCNILNKCV